jgi:hypothetical protein
MPIRLVDQFGGAVSWLGEIFKATPLMMNREHRVAITGWKRSRETRKPLPTPMAVPIANRIGMSSQPLVIPPRSRELTNTTLMSTISGPTDTSRPPPPDTIDGVDAIAASASGASVASSSGRFDGSAKLGWTMIVATSSASDSSRANPNGWRRSRVRRSDTDGLAEERRHELRVVELAPGQLARELVIAEHEHPVHQLDMLIDLRREHHHRHPGARQLP